MEAIQALAQRIVEKRGPEAAEWARHVANAHLFIGDIASAEYWLAIHREIDQVLSGIKNGS